MSDSDNVTIGGMAGYLFLQTALLFSAYGLGYSLPFWVLWFPSLFMVGFFIVVFIVLIIAGLFS